MMMIVIETNTKNITTPSTLTTMTRDDSAVGEGGAETETSTLSDTKNTGEEIMVSA